MYKKGRTADITSVIPLESKILAELIFVYGNKCIRVGLIEDTHYEVIMKTLQ